jgi:hypothetical protein
VNWIGFTTDKFAALLVGNAARPARSQQYYDEEENAIASFMKTLSDGYTAESR